MLTELRGESGGVGGAGVAEQTVMGTQRGDKIWFLLCKITAAAWRTDLFLGGGHKEKKALAPIQASDAGGVVWR